MGNYRGRASPVTSWNIIFSLAAVVQVVMSQPMLTSSVEQACPGNMILFTCTTTGSSTLTWSSEDYIGSGRQLQFRSIDGNGTVENSTFNPETIATLTAVNTNGPILMSILHIIPRSTPNISVSCTNAGGETRTLTIPLAAVPGVPQMISAAEISRPRDNLCIILVTWSPPANSDTSDIGQYIVYVPSRNIRDDVSSSTLTTLTVPNCGDDIRIQVAAVSRIGCVGINSSEVQLILLDIPTASNGNGSTTTDDGLATTEGESATTEGGSTQTSTSAIAAASVLAILFIILCIILVVVLVLFARQYKRGKKIQATEQVFEEHVMSETKLIGDLRNRVLDTSVKRNLEELYNALKLELPSRNIQVAAGDLRATLILGRESSKFNEKVKEVIISYLEKLKGGEGVQRAIENMDNMVTGMMGINEEFKTSVRLLHTKKIGTDEYKKVLDDFIERVEEVQPDTITRFLLTLCEKIKLRNIRQLVKDYYHKQSKYDVDKLGTEKDRVSVPIWVDDELDDSWKDSLSEAVKAINEAAPGLTLSITDNKKRAIIHVLAINKEEPYTEVEGNILMRLSTENFVTEIRLGKWKDDWKKGVCIHELFHALGFHHEHQDAITESDSKYVYHLDSGKQISIDENELGFIQFESSTTTLYPCEKKCRGHSEAGHVCKWVLKAYPTKVNTDLDEHDRVSLNLVYPPCIDKTANNAGYKPKLGKTGMYYCGRINIVLSHITPKEEYTCPCGPDNGPNCSACRTIKSPRVKEILAGGKWQGMSGRVYCGRPFCEPGKLFRTHDGTCGLDNGPACPDCINILNKEHVQSASHPLSLVQ